VVLLVAGALALALVAGLLVVVLWPRRDRAPFDEALADLSAARAVGYRTSLPGSVGAIDVRVTDAGDATGSLTVSRVHFDYLQLEGRTYIKTPPGLLPPGLAEAGFTDRWMAVSAGPLATMPALEPPGILVRRLRKALAGATKYSGASGPAVTVDGVAVLAAESPTGVLYVTKDSPHRMVRFTPAGAGSPSAPPGLPTIPSLPSLPSRSGRPSLPSLPPVPSLRSAPRRVPTSGLGQIDFSSLGRDQIDGTYDDLESRARQLTTAVDPSIQFSLQGQAAIACTGGGCSVTATVSGGLTAGGRTRIVSGKVDAQLSASITIDGRPGGLCTSSGPLTVAGTAVSGQLGCSSPAAGAVFLAVKTEKEAQARARGGGVVVINYGASVQVYATAMVQAEVEAQVNRLRDERARPPRCGRPNSFAAGTRVLMADGGTRPIERIAAGDRILAGDPLTGRTVVATVLAPVRGSGERAVDEITITDGTVRGTVVATDEHPFWYPAGRRWIDAGDLRAGDQLGSADGRREAVVATGHSRRHLVTYNLSVSGPRTYFVVAGGATVLVHNKEDQCWQASEDDLDAIFDRYGPDVTQGVEYNIRRYNEGATDHALNGIGTDARRLADYLAAARQRTFTHFDSLNRSTQVWYDDANQILVVRNAQMVHAYNYSRASWQANAGTRYIEN
jgi:hypothetical protein